MNDTPKSPVSRFSFPVIRLLDWRRMTPRKLFAGAALVILTLWLLVGLMLVTQRSATLEREAIHVRLLSSVLAARTQRALADAAALSAAVSEKVVLLGPSAALGPLSESLIRPADGLSFLAVLDAEGRPLNAASGLPLPAPSVMSGWVKIAKEARETGPRLGPLSLDDQQKVPVVPMIAPIVARDGRNMGAVVVGISPSYLTLPFAPRDLGQKARVMVVGPDAQVWSWVVGSGEWGAGEAIANSVLYRAMLAQHQGSAVLPGAVDPVERVESFTPIGDWKMWALAGTATDEVLADWQQHVAAYAALGLLMTGLVSLLAIWGAASSAREAELAAALVAAYDSAEAAARLKGEFVTTMSHEVRTPLSSVVGYAELLAERELDQEARQNFARMIMQAGQQITRIVDDLLDLSKIEASKLPIEREQVVLRELVDACAALHRKDAAAKTLAFSTTLENDVPDTLYTDRTRLTQIVSNLLGNAVKFTTRGFVLLHVSRRGDNVLFAVSDSGPGIARKYRSQIFERFRQGEPELSIKHGGTGLGLPLVKALAILMGGTVMLESEEGKGSTFTVELPIMVKPPG